MKPRVKKRNKTNENTSVHIPFIFLFIGSGFFTGFVPAFSGTVSSVAAVLIYLLIDGIEQWSFFLLIIVLFYFIGIKASQRMIIRYGNDPAEVTIDEIVGMWVSLIFLPKTLLVSTTAFILFRLFDIFKPYPINFFYFLHNGFGIMTDDVIAGIYANICVQLLLFIPYIKEILIIQ